MRPRPCHFERVGPTAGFGRVRRQRRHSLPVGTASGASGRPPEETPFPEPRRERVQTLLPVDLEIEERVEEVESRYPERDGAAERPSRPGEPPRDRNPGA